MKDNKNIHKATAGLVMIITSILMMVVLTTIQEAMGGPPSAATPPTAPAPAPAPGVSGPAASTQPSTPSRGGGLGLFTVITSSGILGILIWIGLFADAGIGVYLVVDCLIMVKPSRIMPQALIDNVTQAMNEGDVLKALEACEKEPGPLANILIAGFSRVEEGFEIIQEAISAAADFETEKLMQKITWLAVVANLAPMLGLLGTVQGMIWAFATLGMSGTPNVALLALCIAQALYTTAAGLCIAIPIIGIFYALRNNANRCVLKMQAMTRELIKDLRNVEVVEE